MRKKDIIVMNKLKLNLLILFLFTAPLLHASYSDDSAIIEKLGREAINTLTSPNSKLPEIEAKFLTLLTRDFAVKDIAQFVLGRYWKTANDEQKNRFVSIFQHRLKKAYASRFKEFTGVSFKVNNSRQESGYGVVSSTIQKPQGPEIPVDWWIKNEKTQNCKP